MKVLCILPVILLISSVGYIIPAHAISISGISANNLSTPDIINPEAFRFRELRSANIDTTPVSGDINQRIFSNQFSWMFGHRVNQPDAFDFALIFQHPVGYEITFTVEDPLNQGYIIDVDHNLRGYLTVDRAEPVRIDAGGGVMVGRFLDGVCAPAPSNECVENGLSVLGAGILTVLGNDPAPFQNQLVTHSDSFTSNAFVGTQTFTVQFNSAPSPGGSTTFQNFGGGEANVRFGLEPTIPQLVNGGVGSDGEPSSDFGHFTTITVTAIEQAVEEEESVISGELINTDSMALMIAGLNSSAIFVLPIVGAVLGFGLYKLRKI